MSIIDIYRVSLPGLFDIMRSDDDRLVSVFRDLNKMVPYAIMAKIIKITELNACNREINRKPRINIITFDEATDLRRL